MLLYFAGDRPWKQEKRLNKFWDYRLWSYYFITQKEMDDKKKKVELFLDSGAFSAWSQKSSINIKEYIAFIKENEHLIDVYANLDVIGNSKASWRNQRIMEKAGLKPMPVYHLEDPIEDLHKCVEEYEYFGLGGMARGVRAYTRREYLDKCFNIICDTPDRMPKCKVHGFGMTSLTLMLLYPWYSVDSTTWVITGRVGSIFVPKRSGGKWIYDETSLKLDVSNKNPTKNKRTSKAGVPSTHIDQLKPEQKKVFVDYLNEKGYGLGKSEFKMVNQQHKLAENEKWFENKPKDKHEKRELEIIIEPGLSNDYKLRDELNIIYFLDLEKSIQPWPWPFISKKQKGLGI